MGSHWLATEISALPADPKTNVKPVLRTKIYFCDEQNPLEYFGRLRHFEPVVSIDRSGKRRTFFAMERSDTGCFVNAVVFVRHATAI